MPRSPLARSRADARRALARDRVVRGAGVHRTRRREVARAVQRGAAGLRYHQLVGSRRAGRQQGIGSRRRDARSWAGRVDQVRGARSPDAGTERADLRIRRRVEDAAPQRTAGLADRGLHGRSKGSRPAPQVERRQQRRRRRSTRFGRDELNGAQNGVQLKNGWDYFQIGADWANGNGYTGSGRRSSSSTPVSIGRIRGCPVG